VQAVTVTDAAGNAVALTKISDGEYTFRMPARDVTVTAVFAQTDALGACPRDASCPMAAYPDLNRNEWYHDGVHFCIENSLMKGYSDGTFQPDTAATRAVIVAALWQLEGKPVVNYAMTFEDVAQDAWYAEAVRWAASVGVVEGYSDEAFGPEDSITREQLAAILYRYEQHRGGGFKGSWMFRMDYTDLADVSDWAYEAMCWCTMNPIIEGKPGKLLDPKGTAARAQAAAMLHRYCEVLTKEA